MFLFKSSEKLQLFLFTDSISEIKVAIILEDKKWNTKAKYGLK